MTRVFKVCIYPACKWKRLDDWSEPMSAMEDAIRAHLDEAHPDWTMEELRAMAAESDTGGPE